MNRLWNTDGLSRKQWEAGKELGADLQLLEADFPALMGRLSEMMQVVRYYGVRNQPEGYWEELFRFQPLQVLTEIAQWAVEKREKEFLQRYEQDQEACFAVCQELAGQLTEWEYRLAYWSELRLTRDLQIRPHLQNKMTGKEETKRVFYILLGIVRRLQKNYDVYLKEIEHGGKNDPGISILEVFLRHYQEIVARFNARWKDFPDFYIREILKARPAAAIPDAAWVKLTKSSETADVLVPEGTALVAGRNADGRLFCYRTAREVKISEMSVDQLYTVFLEKDKGRFPAARLDYVTSVCKNKWPSPFSGSPFALFEASEGQKETVGLAIESPLLLLREGVRNVELSFGLTSNGVVFFDRLIQKIAGESREEEKEIIYKLLKDAFYLEISTAEGWDTIADYGLSYEEHRSFLLKFRLNEVFPETVNCLPEKHQQQTDSPVLRILMNRNAWLFPYSWAREVAFETLLIRTEVTGVSAVKLYTVHGEADPSAPFYVLGVQPEKGAWLVAGNYEMAIKPLRKIGIAWRWEQLPDDPQGLYGYYLGYGKDVDNDSFRIGMEWLEEKKWQRLPASGQSLFAGIAGEPVRPAGPLPLYNLLEGRLPENLCGLDIEEERYQYGYARSGFLRLVLEAPEMGFGHAAYRNLFAEVMMQNARRRHPLPLPALPFAPMADQLKLQYVAEEQLEFAAGNKPGRTRLSYICPLASEAALTMDKPVYFVDGPDEAGHLLLGIRKAEGYDRIRFRVEVAPLRKEIDFRDMPRWLEAPQWYMHKKNGWKLLPEEAVQEDSSACFMKSGIVELLLPEPVLAGDLDQEGLFWLRAVFQGPLASYPLMRGFYMNAVEVISDTAGLEEHPESRRGIPAGSLSEWEENIPGITAVEQLMPGRGGQEEETREDMRLRIAHRIAHRNRAVVPADYERLVMEHFPQVAKVKCLPGMDTKGQNRQGIVTLVVVPRPVGEEWPLAAHDLLLAIEEYLSSRVGAFVLVDAINPVYEKMKVRCRVTLEKKAAAAEVLRRVEENINQWIMPWKKTDGVPVFGYRFSLASLKNALLDEPGIAALEGLTVLHVAGGKERIYRLQEYHVYDTRTELIGASVPWGVAVTDSRHLVETSAAHPWEEEAGVGQLEIGGTFVIC